MPIQPAAGVLDIRPPSERVATGCIVANGPSTLPLATCPISTDTAGANVLRASGASEVSGTQLPGRSDRRALSRPCTSALVATLQVSG